MINVNIQHLETFVSVVDQGGFTRAAAQLYLAQSTMSNHVQMLESELGVTVFRRESKKKLELTESGQCVYRYAKEIIGRCRALEKELSGSENELIIGTSTLPSLRIVPGLVSGFLKEYPDCSFVVRTGNSGDTRQQVLDGTVQVGFVGDRDNLQILAYHCVAEDHLVMVTPNTPYFTEKKAAGVYGREMLSEPVILREDGSGTQRVTDKYLSSVDVSMKDLHVVARVSSPDVLRDMVIQGAGVSILSDSTVQNQVSNGELLKFELDEIPVSRNIYMVHRQTRNISSNAKRFIDFVISHTGSGAGRV